MTATPRLQRASHSDNNIPQLQYAQQAAKRVRHRSHSTQTHRPLNSPHMVKTRSKLNCITTEQHYNDTVQQYNAAKYATATAIPVLQYNNYTTPGKQPLHDVHSPIASVKQSAHKSAHKAKLSVVHSTPTTAATQLLSSAYTYIHPVYDGDEFDPFVFIKQLPPLHAVQQPRTHLPHATHALNTLVIDLDETLVHCSITPLEQYDYMFDVLFGGTTYTVYMRCRPYMLHFLQTVSQWYEIVVFTASQSVYANKLLDIIDNQRQYIHHRLFREHCLNIEQNYIKDLTVLNRPLHRILIVDNSIQAFAYQLSNGIPIESWFDNAQDTELLKLLPLLYQLKDVHTDVRPFIEQTFQLQSIVDQVRLA